MFKNIKIYSHIINNSSIDIILNASGIAQKVGQIHIATTTAAAAATTAVVVIVVVATVPRTGTSTTWWTRERS